MNDNISNTEDEIRIPSFIIDDPADISDNTSCPNIFSGHPKVAEAIANAIKNNSKVRTIGIIGPWGSGKSTVIKSVFKELSKEGYSSFLYDTWANQNEQPRIAFLQALLSKHFLSADGKIDAVKLQGLNELSGKIKKELIQSKIHFSNLGILTIIILLFIPLEVKLLDIKNIDFALNHLFKYNDDATFSPALTIGASILILQLLLLFWEFISHLLHKDKESKTDDKISIIQLIFNKEAPLKTVQTTKQPEASSNEYFEYFKERIGELKDKFVFAIDNLDRLDKDTFNSTWAALRCFMSNDKINTSNQVALVPIDTKALKEHLGDKDVEEFTSKSFDICFKINPPIITEWKDYYKSTIKKVFNESIGDNFIELSAYFFEHTFSANEYTTPRQINQKINNIATLWMQRPEIPFITIAYYVAFFEENAIGDDYLDNPKFDLSQYDKEWKTSMFALKYGVEPKTAEQIFLKPKIYQAIEENKVDTLLKLSIETGFNVAIRNQIDSINEYTPSLQFTKTLNAIAELKQIDNIDIIRDILLPKILLFIRIEHLSNDLISTLENFLSSIPQSKLEHYLERLSSPDLFRGANKLLSHGELVLTSKFIELITKIQNKNSFNNSYFNINAPAQNLINIYNLENSVEIYKNIKYGNSFSDILSEIEHSIRTSALDEINPISIKFICDTFYDADWSDVIKQSIYTLQNVSDINQYGTKSAIFIIGNIYKLKHNDMRNNNAIIDSYIYHQNIIYHTNGIINNLSNTYDFDVLAILCVLTIKAERSAHITINWEVITSKNSKFCHILCEWLVKLRLNNVVENLISFYYGRENNKYIVKNLFENCDYLLKPDLYKINNPDINIPFLFEALSNAKFKELVKIIYSRDQINELSRGSRFETHISDLLKTCYPPKRRSKTPIDSGTSLSEIPNE